MSTAPKIDLIKKRFVITFQDIPSCRPKMPNLLSAAPPPMDRDNSLFLGGTSAEEISEAVFQRDHKQVEELQDDCSADWIALNKATLLGIVAISLLVWLMAN